jgi:hypothetical protein
MHASEAEKLGIPCRKYRNMPKNSTDINVRSDVQYCKFERTKVKIPAKFLTIVLYM